MTTEELAAWSTFGAAAIAIFSTGYSVVQVKKQLTIQNVFAKRRIEEDYLARALYVAWDCYNKAALVFISSWSHSR